MPTSYPLLLMLQSSRGGVTLGELVLNATKQTAGSPGDACFELVSTDGQPGRAVFKILQGLRFTNIDMQRVHRRQENLRKQPAAAASIRASSSSVGSADSNHNALQLQDGHGLPASTQPDTRPSELSSVWVPDNVEDDGESQYE